MSKKTPQMYARGRYELKSPWTANNARIYTCIAIRSFEDIYKQGEDVYSLYYAPYIQNGSTTPGGTFSFDNEVLLKPNIITLRSEDNEIIYVPDTFINSFPTTTAVIYSHLIAAVDLGVLPDEYLTDTIESALKDVVLKNFGINGNVEMLRAPSSTNPTPEEHEQLTALREGAIAANKSLETQLLQARDEIERQGEYIRRLEEILSLQQTDNG